MFHYSDWAGFYPYKIGFYLWMLFQFFYGIVDFFQLLERNEGVYGFGAVDAKQNLVVGVVQEVLFAGVFLRDQMMFVEIIRFSFTEVAGRH